jgi:hypothetical protein
MVVTRDAATSGGRTRKEKESSSTQERQTDASTHWKLLAHGGDEGRRDVGWSKEEGEGRQQHVGAPDGRERAIGDASPMVVTRDAATSGWLKVKRDRGTLATRRRGPRGNQRDVASLRS